MVCTPTIWFTFQITAQPSWRIVVEEPGVYWNYFLMGVQSEVLNPYPFLRIFSLKKWLIWQFFQNFCKSEPISKGFFLAQKQLILLFFHCNFGEMQTSLKDFLKIKMDPCTRNFGEKLTHLGGTSLYALICEYPLWEIAHIAHLKWFWGVYTYSTPNILRSVICCTAGIFTRQGLWCKNLRI